ncbi:type I DNA topoisomerase [Elizabethkingia meningoseptica]|uniref:DNA topoisomerase 1 n=1 Tax=Elizabethkingia meningoseptica TaxID=238 RepID=A0A1T3EWP6_ELIME|nr:type I DNA topoisomerase [Elizabethkingia meningoseptica]AQX11618.1 DNA topoisomerase I [Elizabethkingia meningoseptica]MBG0513052.1 type I DNA topoisomerase [Elizabethkingia meningoseptica]MDE5436188.1 type I DNA topoisomerase [Elizabethkingia meningoseptica]OOH94738.1 DNA topoisomerase I [Elizabethkingia meningoseptica]OPB69975.1 DNA topoisomerase I [Elizabethkingia meningoseptica]
MSKNLVIVESPAKAKTIQKYLGNDFEVTSSMGHIRDLPKKGMGINLETFTPDYEVSSDKKKLVTELKALAKKADMVWLASDEDREGEAIAWHLAEELKLKGDKTKRIVFHEITKNAILKAIENPRNIDQNLVNAQQARRVLDRIVGFEMSPVLWKKVKPGLSAGRVQSVAVRLVVEREKEIMNFSPQAAYKVEGTFLNGDKKEILAKLKKDFATEQEAEGFLTQCSTTDFKVLNVEKKPGQRSASAPFTTSTLQQEASNRLGYSVTTTMRVAQRLYEEGYITYMRTDSVNLSQEAINSAKATILKEYGEEYSAPRNYTTKNASAQEAHEAIRPTDFGVKSIGDVQLNKLYQLIHKRAIASQMANAKIEKTVIEIGHQKLAHHFEAAGEVIIFDGFLKVYGITKSEDDEDENDEKLLPKVSIGEGLLYKKIIATEKFTKAPARYTEAALVRKLEELGIGRPSTYAPTIQTIQNREYVDKREISAKEREIVQLTLTSSLKKETLVEKYGADKNKFLPTDIGIVVNDFLVNNFNEILDYGFTARVEEAFDIIAEGNRAWKDVMTEFYGKFHPRIADVEENADRATGDRILGTDPKTGKNIHARIGRFGAMIQIGETDDEEKPIFASLMPHQNISTITLEEALELFKIPFNLNDYEGKEVVVGVGRFGPYIKWGEAYISLPKNVDPLSVDNDIALEIIEEKKKADAPIATYKGEPVTKGTGRFGPFIKYKDIFVNVPKKYDFNNLSQSDINELIDAKLEKEANRYIQQWEDQKVSLENGRWGPFIRFNKKMLKIPFKSKGEKYTAEELQNISFNEVKKWIIAQDETAFKEKAKKAPAKKTAAKKPATKKTSKK